MKKQLHHAKGLLSLSKAILIVLLLGFGLKANAQCIASFTVTDSAGYAVINDMSSGSPLYYWDFGDGTGSSTAGDQIHYYGTGTYNICLMVGDSSSGCFDVSCQSFTIGCSASYAIYVSNDTVYFGSTSMGSGITYTWNFGDGTPVTTGSAYTYHIYPTAGTYYACLTISTSSGCSDTYCDSVVYDTTGGPSGGCSAYFIPNDSSTFAYFYNASTSGAISTWDFGDGTSGTSTGDITHTYSTTGTYWVCLSISTFAGCTDTYCDSVVIGGGGSGSCFAAWNSIVTSDTVSFYDFSTGSASMTYLWDFGDGTTSTVAGDVVHVYPGPGSYMACLTISDSSCTNTYCYTIYVGSSSGGCDASFTLVQDSTNIYNYFCYMNTTPSGGSFSSYYWDFGDGSSSTLQYPSHTYAGSGPYFLCLTVTDTTFMGTVCTDTYCDSLTAGMAMSAPMTLNVLPGSPTAIEETNIISLLESYPNPMTENATINYTITKDADVELMIIDLVGNKIAVLERSSKTSGAYTTSWNSEGVAQGMYLMQLKVNNNISTKKLIITR